MNSKEPHLAPPKNQKPTQLPPPPPPSELKWTPTYMGPMQLCWMNKATGRKDIKVLMWRQAMENTPSGIEYSDWQEIPTSENWVEPVDNRMADAAKAMVEADKFDEENGWL